MRHWFQRSAAGGASLLCIALLTAGLSPGRAASEATYEAIAGKWLFAAEQTGKGCVLTLSREQTIGGRGLDGTAACTGPIGVLANATAWDFDGDGAMVFRDATRKSLLKLSEDEDGNYHDTAHKPGQRLVLVAANEGQERLISEKEMAGTWTFRRPGGTAICSVTLGLTRPPKKDDFFVMSMDPGCDPGLLKLKLVRWHVEAALLVMVGAETADLSLVPKAGGHFVKAAKEGGKPLEMVRK